jgi:hypothetical protein
MNARYTRVLSSLLPSLISVPLAIAAAGVFSAPASADPHLSDQDQYPTANYPPTYNSVQTKILDITSNLNVASPYLQIDYVDLKVEREFNSFRAITREMMDMQTLGDNNIRVRDLANPYTTALSCFSSYYQTIGATAPTDTGSCPAIEVKEEIVMAPPAPAPIVQPPAPPVPALW